MKLPAKKPTKRGRSRIDKLPQAVRDEILQRAVDGESWAKIRAWLRSEKRCRINSDTVISQWYSKCVLHQQLQEQMERHSHQVDSMLAFLQREMPEMPQEKLERFGQNLFSVMALRTEDPKVWASIYKLNLKARELELDREKLELLKRKAEAADKAKDVVDSKLTPAEKLTRIRQIFGMPT